MHFFFIFNDTESRYSNNSTVVTLRHIEENIKDYIKKYVTNAFKIVVQRN